MGFPHFLIYKLTAMTPMWSNPSVCCLVMTLALSYIPLVGAIRDQAQTSNMEQVLQNKTPKIIDKCKLSQKKSLNPVINTPYAGKSGKPVSIIPNGAAKCGCDQKACPPYVAVGAGRLVQTRVNGGKKFA